MNLFELIRSRIADPKRPFLIGAGGSTLSYGEMLDRTGQICRADHVDAISRAREMIDVEQQCTARCLREFASQRGVRDLTAATDGPDAVVASSPASTDVDRRAGHHRGCGMIDEAVGATAERQGAVDAVEVLDRLVARAAKDHSTIELIES